VAAAIGSFITQRRNHDKNEFNFHPIIEVAVLFAGIFVTMIPALDWLELNAAKLNMTTPDNITGEPESFPASG